MFNLKCFQIIRLLLNWKFIQGIFISFINALQNNNKKRKSIKLKTFKEF